MKRFAFLFLLLLLALGAIFSWGLSDGFVIAPRAESTGDSMSDPEENETAQEEVTESPEKGVNPEQGATAAPPSNEGALKLSGPVTVDECARQGSAACTIAMEQDRALAVKVLKKQLKENPAARRYIKTIAMSMPPFSVVGKVVDGGGAPLPGVDVVYRVGMPYSLGYSHPAHVVTNEQGIFEINGRAASLLLRSLDKPGYEPASGFSGHLEFGARPQFGHEPWSTATAQSPRVFTMVPSQP